MHRSESVLYAKRTVESPLSSHFCSFNRSQGIKKTKWFFFYTSCSIEMGVWLALNTSNQIWMEIHEALATESPCLLKSSSPPLSPSSSCFPHLSPPHVYLSERWEVQRTGSTVITHPEPSHSLLSPGKLQVGHLHHNQGVSPTRHQHLSHLLPAHTQ